MLELFERSKIQKTDYDADYRIVLPDGAVKHIHTIGHPVLNESGEVVEFVGTNMDITERKQSEEKLRQSELEARQLIDLSPIHIGELGPGGTPERVYNNQTALAYFGMTLEQWRAADWNMLVHPQDAERTLREFPSKFLNGSPFAAEVRLKRRDGQYRWFHYRIKPMRDEQGRITRWYSVGTDIEDRKAAEQRLQNENVALREEIDKASMFERIVGTSPALQGVLSRVSKVAPLDSTVLITGETGTGKELVARAIHRRSKRSSRPFISVNCAAIPRDLIASELFGHEKGAFTGATQQRLGRFELADGGTIFLDEVGEIPAETQIALLRVLQENEFERVGGGRSIRTDVRVVAATNRDLQAAIEAGAFRSDLFYRLNVFPIEIPSLRERREDIPLLVEYFIDRYARKAGKSFQAINKKTLDLLQAYRWAGNIRELQNVIERSVIVCDTENFSVDESWLSRQPRGSETKSHLGLSGKLATQEKEMIEAALRESGGRVSGQSGAAAKLGIPGPTLESKIKSLKIDKYRFKTMVSSPPHRK
jgi:formate hydrogenlyase transcriptional activator